MPRLRAATSGDHHHDGRHSMAPTTASTFEVACTIFEGSWLDRLLLPGHDASDGSHSANCGKASSNATSTIMPRNGTTLGTPSRPGASDDTGGDEDVDADRRRQQSDLDHLDHEDEPDAGSQARSRQAPGAGR